MRPEIEILIQSDLDDIICEIYKLNLYLERDYKISFLKTKDGVEIDLIVEISARKKYCIAIKAGEVKDLSAFNAQYKLAKDLCAKELIVLSQNKIAQVQDGIHVMPWQEGIETIMKLGIERAPT